MKKKKLLIFGLGHLSRFLLKEFKDWEISGTFRSEEKVADLDVEKHFLDLGSLNLDFLKNSYDLIVFTIPPREGYGQLLKECDELIDVSTPWIFTSSTSVFSRGLSNELSEKNGKTKNALLLIKLEEQLSMMKRITTIIRPSGIVDHIRNPKNFFQRDSAKVIGSDITHFVHSEDIARLYLCLSEVDTWEESYNLVSPKSYLKKNFYQAIDRLYNCFNNLEYEEIDQVVRKVSSLNLEGLNFEFKYPDILEFFKELHQES